MATEDDLTFYEDDDPFVTLTVTDRLGVAYPLGVATVHLDLKLDDASVTGSPFLCTVTDATNGIATVDLSDQFATPGTYTYRAYTTLSSRDTTFAYGTITVVDT